MRLLLVVFVVCFSVRFLFAIVACRWCRSFFYFVFVLLFLFVYVSFFFLFVSFLFLLLFVGDWVSHVAVCCGVLDVA